MKPTIYSFLIFLLTISTQNCSNESPTSETVPPPLPSGIPNALALDNLSLIRILEKNRRNDTALVQISVSSLKKDGRVSEGNAWAYTFAKPDSMTLYSWEVFSDGHVKELEAFPTGGGGPFFSSTDIEEFVKINSLRALNVGLKHGGNIYLKKFPDALITMRYHFTGGVPVCWMQFEKLGTFCPIEITISSQTGEVVEKNLACNDK